MFHYSTLQTAPDFRQPPSGGVYVPRTDTDISGAPILTRWKQRTARTQTFNFVLRGPTELRDFRAFIMETRGNWKPFYCPSWFRDIIGSGTVSAGDRTARIATDPTGFLTSENRPDTPGRTLYFYTPARGLHFARILGAAEQGDGTWELTLSLPFPWAADLEKCLIGFAWFVRLAGQDLTMVHLSPDRAEIEVAVIEARNFTAYESDHEINGPTFYGSEPFRYLHETNAEPTRADMRESLCLGPNNWGTAQTENPSKQWRFALEMGVVAATRGAGTYTSDLFNGNDSVEMISAAFDVLGVHALAWQQSKDSTRLRWYKSGVPQTLNLPGTRTPLLFQNWTVNGVISAGDADLILYYLRPGDSKLFARWQREDFAIERAVALLPVAPLALLEHSIANDRHTIRAISARHTLLEIVSNTYVLPVPPVADDAAAQVHASGSYDYMVVDLPTGPESASAVLGIAGEYVSMTLDPIGLPLEHASGMLAISGEYVSMVIDHAGRPVDDAEANVSVSGMTKLVASDAELDAENAGAGTRIYGTYEQV